MPEPPSHEPRAPRKREPYAHLRALGPRGLPERFRMDGCDADYRLVATFKHDFFAASGLYEGPHGRVVLKMGRCADLCGLPTDWIGRWLISREVRFYSQLQDLEGVPRLLGRLGELGFAHEFVPGHTLGRHEYVPDGFFDRLTSLLAAMHVRGVAYVDLEKRENIIVGDDGRPYLIDFQISWRWPWRRGRDSRLARWLLGRFAAADRYHLAKHIRRCRPDLMTADQVVKSRRVSPIIRVHRALFRPLTLLRRRVLAHVHRARAAHRDATPEGE